MRRLLARVFAVVVALSGPALAADPPPPVPSGLAVAGVEVVAERDLPQVCVTFSDRLEKSRAVDYRAYVEVRPAAGGDAVETAAVPRDRTLCIEGPEHGKRYRLLLREGLPGASGLRLATAESHAVEVPDRAPALAFRGAGYILPRVGSEGLPLRTVNVDRARLQVLRINDRNLVEQIYYGRITQQLSDYDVGEIVGRAGEEVWRGEMAVDAVRNAPVVTAFPIDAVLGTLKPGVYIAVATADAVRKPEWESKATQWFVVSDLGLSTIQGEDGLLVFARSLATADPVAGVELRLLARNNAELGTAQTGPDGMARFDAGLLRGSGGGSAQALFAYHGSGDFSFLDLSAPAFDLSDRGVGGREAPGPLDAFLYPERGIYRPGETVNLALLLRDADARAVTGLPLTLKVLRPDGFEVERRSVTDAGSGAYATRIAIPVSAYTGQWSVTAHTDPDGAAVGRADFLVEDFVPPRLEFTLRSDAEALETGTPVPLDIDARFFYGAAAAGLPGELTLTLRAAAAPYPQHPGFRFGLAQEEFLPVRSELPGFTTDDAGTAVVDAALDDHPDSTRPLEAVVRATLFDIGGRPVNRELVLPVHHQPFAIGVRPHFEGDAVPEGATVAFDIIAVAPDGTTVAAGDLSYELFEEEYDYVWFQANGRWDYEMAVRDRRLTGGSLRVGAEAPATLEEPVAAGRYRLEVFDRATGVATSLRFAAGWWVSPSAGDRPDKVDVTVMLPAYRGGESAWVYVKPPYRSQVLVAVADRRVHRAITRPIGPEGAFLEIPVDPSWTAGVYVTATAFAVPEPGHKGPPRRALGLSWLAMDPEPRSLDVALAAPENSEPRRTVDVEVTVAGAEPGTPAFVTLAAVDEAVLQLTDYASPDPNDYYLGKRQLAVDLRDVYGKLIDPSGAQRGRIRSGGDAQRVRQVGTLPQKTTRVVSLFSGIRPVGEGGTVSIPLDLPDFQGRLRLMAVAWSDGKVGRAEARMQVRDPVVADLSLPRFLAPGDRAQVLATLDNLHGAAGDYAVTVTAAGAVALEDGAFSVPGLAPGRRATAPRVLTATGVGTGSLTMTVEGPDGLRLERQWDITVRPANPVATRRLVARLAPEKSFTATPDITAGMVPGTATVALSISPLPELDVPGLLLALDRYPYGCAEQVTSRALPLLYVNDVAQALGLAGDEALKGRVRRAVERVMTMQRPDGSFAMWSPRGDGDLWLTPYVMDFLGRARGAGYSVPDFGYRKGLEWLKQLVDNSWYEEEELPARAYALLVLARAGATDIAAVRYFQETYWTRLQTDLARAQVAAALAALGDGARAADAFAGLNHARVVQASLRDYGSAVRDEAGVVALMAESGAVDRDRLLAAATRLHKAYAAQHRTSTQEQAWLLLAARALIDRAGPMRLTLDGATMEGSKPFYRRIDPAAPFSVTNAGTEPLHQVVTVAGVPADPQPPEEAGMTIHRRVFAMDGTPLDAGAGGKPSPDGPVVAQNEMLVVILEGRSTERLDHQALVVDLLPAGFEIENVRLADSAQLGDLSWLGELSAVRHVDYRDDRFVAAVDLTADSPSFRLVYLVRAVTAGDFARPGAYVEDMYRPYLAARGPAGRVSVRAP
ncbi:alpha-2-macroglobulin family protein [Azospirillum halopraeferens]|uniref:alpha-2-macroglobulin family protein n=1 Tax=Azospirillum halopraeferens TaxID=34010 RepID=UPI0003F9A18E|nr:alpha-2-macroglobulin [Azospirillum halopraeferens]